MMRKFKMLHLFAGSGGAALGCQRARARYGEHAATFETLLGVDIDEAACADFRALTAAPAVQADLATMTPRELLAACRGERPDAVLLSPPCKGYSGLLSNKRSLEEKYQRLNRLVIQGVGLVMGTWALRPPSLIVLENVPRIATRGAEFLAQVRALLLAHGYRTHEGFHDCGEIGGLAQHRRRFLLVARHERSVPSFVYEPPKRRVRAIGEVLGPMPMPDDPRGGPMHTLPRLEWRTWVRLALIPAGKDWRALGVKDGKRYNNVFRIVPWSAPSVAVTGGGTPTSGGVAVADPRVTREHHRGTFGVIGFDEPAGTVTGNGRVSAGAFTVADPRLPPSPARHEAKFRVERWDDAAHAVTGSDRVGSGAPSIADPRIAGQGSRPDLFGVLDWNAPAKTISGHASVSGSNCPSAVADPRIGSGVGLYGNHYRVEDWSAPSPTITGAPVVVAGAISVADPRVGAPARAGTYGVASWDAPAPTVIGSSDVHAGTSAVADPRLPGDRERPDPPPVIVSLDGTWHRPLTTLELAALQGFPVFAADGTPLVLAGAAHSRWRERIGNAIPPDAAEAIGEQLLRALLAAAAGATFDLSSTNVWVQDEATR